MALPDKTTMVICQKCERFFPSKTRIEVRNGREYDLTKRKGRTCPECKKLNEQRRTKKRNAKLKKRPGEKRIFHPHHKQHTTQTKLEDVAKTLGITFENAKAIERKALAKIRSNPELVKLFRQWMEEGGRAPESAERGLILMQQDVGETLVDYMLELSKWYELYGTLLGNGRETEALECRREIEQFHTTFKKQLELLLIE